MGRLPFRSHLTINYLTGCAQGLRSRWSGRFLLKTLAEGVYEIFMNFLDQFYERSVPIDASVNSSEHCDLRDKAGVGIE
jgi:hypothetical protein